MVAVGACRIRNSCIEFRCKSPVYTTPAVDPPGSTIKFGNLFTLNSFRTCFCVLRACARVSCPLHSIARDFHNEDVESALENKIAFTLSFYSSTIKCR